MLDKMPLGYRTGCTTYGLAPQRGNGIARIREWSQKVRVWLMPAEPILRCMYWAYILENAAGTFYIGHTVDRDARLVSHTRDDKLRGKFTCKRGPWHLVWSEPFQTRSQAMARERQIKGMKSARLIRDSLLKGGVPTGRD